MTLLSLIMVLYENNIIKIKLYPEYNLLNDIWKPGHISENQWMEAEMKLTEFLAKEDINKTLTFSDDLEFLITPPLQKWLVAYLHNNIPFGKIKKSAIVKPKDFVANLGLQQFIDDKRTIAEIKYFSDRKEAFDWLTGDIESIF